MARIHQRIHDVPAPDALPDLNDVLRIRVGSAKQLPHGLKESALSVLDSLPRGDRICHGDFHPGNVLGSLDAPVVIDWPDAARGDPLADVAGTELLVRFGEVPPGTSLLVRGASAAVRRIIAERYVAVYRRVRPFDPRILLRWKIVQAAARFSAEIPSEYEALRAFLVSAGRLARSSR
jgi:aminoglycoside phosphotransferase (APT) family kinase protein